MERWKKGRETHWDIDFAEHGDSFSDVGQRDVLWCAHDNCAYDPDQTAPHQLRLTSPRTSKRRADAPLTRTSCPSVSGTSPVPGGISTTRTSRSFPDASFRQSTSNSSCWTAFCTISPRQTTAVFSRDAEGVSGGGRGRRKPMDMHGMPWFVSGRIAPSGVESIDVSAIKRTC